MKIGKAVVVGMGGIGCQYVPTLARLLPRVPAPKIVLIDGDKYLPKNANRQFLSVRYSGLYKAEAMSEYMRMYYPAIASICRFVEDDEAFAGIVVDNNVSMRQTFGEDSVVLVALCVDNDATRRIVYDGIRMSRANVIVVDMANERTTGDVIVWAWLDGESVGPFPPDVYPNLKNPTDRPPNAYCSVQVEQKGGEQIVTANMMAAAVGLEYTRKIMENEPFAWQIGFNLSPQYGKPMMWSV